MSGRREHRRFAYSAEQYRIGQAYLAAADQALAAGPSKTAVDLAAQHVTSVAHRLNALALQAAPGWLGLPVGTLAPTLVTGRDAAPAGPVPVRVGEAHCGLATFPALAPLLGVGHLAIDRDVTEPAIAGLVRALLLRLIAATPPGMVQVRSIDCAGVGRTLAAFRALTAAGVMSPPAVDEAGIEQVWEDAAAHLRRIATMHGDGADVSAQPYLVVVVSLSELRSADLERVRGLAASGPSGRLHLIMTGWVGAGDDGRLALLPSTTHITTNLPTRSRPADDAHGPRAILGEPPGGWRFSDADLGLAALVELDPDPPAELVAQVCEGIAERFKAASACDFAFLLPSRTWAESSAAELTTVVGRDAGGPVVLSFDDATPHWLVGGRTGSGKSVFLLDLLYSLATRYSPAELSLYLLDFKEGVQFAEFTPTAHDPSFVPHVRAVGVESDREYGVAVLEELSAELVRRSMVMKSAGVTKLADLRAIRPDLAIPRTLAVIDEFHVLFAGNDRLAGRAVALLEELARKGRSYGIHLVLASQTASGVEALYGKQDSIFGQFPLRVALAGAKGVLDILNSAADGLPVGAAVVNSNGGVRGYDTLIRFPNAHAEAARVAELRRHLWRAAAGNEPPKVFRGFAEHHVEDALPGLAPDTASAPVVVVGRVVDVAQSTAVLPLDERPGRHVAILGPSGVGADILHAAALGLGRQHRAGTATFLLASLVRAEHDTVEQARAALGAAGHDVRVLDVDGLRQALGQLADSTTPPAHRTYLVVFGMDAAGPALQARSPDRPRPALDDLRAVLKQGPSRGVHMLGWWRQFRRFTEDVGGTVGREDVAGLVALNVAGNDLAMWIGQVSLDWQPRPNRALVIDRHDDRRVLVVPFVRAGRQGAAA